MSELVTHSMKPMESTESTKPVESVESTTEQTKPIESKDLRDKSKDTRDISRLVSDLGCAKQSEDLIPLWKALNDHKNPKRISQFVECRGFDTILEIVKSFPQDPVIQEYGLQILRIAGGLQTKDTIKDVMVLFVEAMKNFQCTSKIQLMGCSFLYQVVASSSSPLGPLEGLETLLQNGGLNCVLYTNRTFPYHINITKKALSLCEILLQFEDVLDGKVQYFISAILEYAMQALQKQNRNLDIQILGVNILCRMAFIIPRRDFRESGALVDVLNSMKNHPENQDILMSGCIACRTVMYDFQNREIFCDNHGPSIIVTILANDKMIEPVLEEAIQILELLVDDYSSSDKFTPEISRIISFCQKTAAEYEIQNAIIPVMNKYRSNSRISTSGSCILAWFQEYSQKT